MSERPLIVLANGAGVPSSSPWMQAWAERLRTFALVHTFDYPYQAAGRKLPDRLPKLIQAHREAVDEARRVHGERPLVLVGKSMGSRVGCHLSLELEVRGLVCLGFPLIGQNGERRDQVLRDLRTPVLFVQGTRDALAPLEDLAAVRAEMTARHELHVVPTGDHSLLVTRAHTEETGRTQDDEDAAALAAVRAFVGTLTP